MEVKIESSSILKPTYEADSSPQTMTYIPLSCFDKVAYNAHVGITYAFRSAVPSATLKLGLQRALAVYREWAGRLGKDHKGEDVILLHDHGLRFIEASVDGRLDQTFNFLKPSPALLSLHPAMKDVDELLQVQVTTFTCGSMVIGLTAHHKVADGHTTSNFLVAWGRACRGLDIGPLPLHDRESFVPRDPPEIEFDHFGKEYKSRKMLENDAMRFNNIAPDDIVMDRLHFSMDFLTKLKARANSVSVTSSDITDDDDRRAKFTTLECLTGHLWRAMTKARTLSSDETTYVKISVNGRSRMNPKVPNHYFGNLVLWALPKARVKDLLREPLSYSVKQIHEAIAKINDSYYKSFVDYSATTLQHDRDIVPIMAVDNPVLCPGIDIESWLRLPFHDLDFGCGSPYLFMPVYFPMEGNIFILPSYVGDGSIDVFAATFKDQLECFRQNCYILD